MNCYQRISVNPIAGALGAEVGGVHLGRLEDEALDEVRAAFLEHQVLFFRDQEITREQHKTFGRRFGTLQIHPYLLTCSRSKTKEIPSSWCFKVTNNIRMSRKPGTAT